MAVEILIPLGFFTLVGFIVWVVSNNVRQRRIAVATAEFNTKLLDRIASAKDFGDFLQTDSGARLMNSLTTTAPAPLRKGGAERVMRAAEIGAVLTTLGLGLIMFGRRFGSEFEDSIFVGTIALSLGVGFILAATTSFFLGRQLGVIPPEAAIKD